MPLFPLTAAAAVTVCACVRSPPGSPSSPVSAAGSEHPVGASSLDTCSTHSTNQVLQVLSDSSQKKTCSCNMIQEAGRDNKVPLVCSLAMAENS